LRNVRVSAHDASMVPAQNAAIAQVLIVVESPASDPHPR